MPKKKKPKSKPAKSKIASIKRSKKSVKKKRARTPKKTSKKTQPNKKTQPKKKASSTTAARSRARRSPERRTQRLESSWAKEDAIAARQSGDLEGLSRAEQADSESVDELVEEGNVFEAGAVAGVEEADDEDNREVHTHEVPEDDVPEEYLDKDE